MTACASHAQSLQRCSGVCLILCCCKAVQLNGLDIVLRTTLTILKHDAQVDLSACTPLCCCKAPPLHRLVEHPILNSSTFQPQTARCFYPPQRSSASSPDIFSNTSAVNKAAAESALAVRAAQRRPSTGKLKTLVAHPSPRPLCLQIASSTGTRAKARSSAACPQLSAASLYRCSPYKHWPYVIMFSAPFFETRKWRREITQQA